MRNSLIDAGPLIALFDAGDQFHDQVLNWIESYEGTLYTTWPVITETVVLLDFHQKVQMDFLQWVASGGIQIAGTEQNLIKRVRQLMDKYKNVPMDLADATLVVLAENMNILDIATLDSDFNIYRVNDRKAFKNLLSDAV